MKTELSSSQQRSLRCLNQPVSCYVFRASSSKPRKAKKKSGKKAEDDGDFDETVDVRCY